MNNRSQGQSQSKGKKWILLDSIISIQSELLTTEKLQSAIFKISEKELERYFIWTEGWHNWQSLKNYLKSSQKDFVQSPEDLDKTLIIKESPRVIKADTQVETVIPSQKEPKRKILQKLDTTQTYTLPVFENPKTQTFNLQNNPYSQRPERYDLRIDVLLINIRNKSFRSFSQNISISGCKIEENIPFEFYNEPFELLLINRKSKIDALSKIKVQAQVIGEGLTQRIQFLNLTPDLIKKIKSFIDDVLNQQNELKKIS